MWTLDKHAFSEMITDVHIKLLGKSHRDLLEGWWYCRKFHNTMNNTQEAVPQQSNHWCTTQVWCPPDSDPHHGTVLHWWHLPTIWTIILKVAYYKNGKLMPIRFFTVDTKNEIVIYHLTSTQLGLQKVLCHNRAKQQRYLHTIRKQA